MLFEFNPQVSVWSFFRYSALLKSLLSQLRILFFEKPLAQLPRGSCEVKLRFWYLD